MNFFLQVRESVIDFKFYRSIKDNKFSRSFVYLLLLFMIIYFINGTKTFIVSRMVIDEVVTGLSAGMPDFRLENGEFIFEGKMPYKISGDNEAFIIDTTGSTDEEALRDAETGILITKDKLYIKRNAVEMREFNLKEFNTITVSKSDLLEFLPKLSWIVLIFIAFGFVFVLGWKLLNAVLLALLGLAANAMTGGRLKFNNLMNISIYALTLPMLIQLAVNLYGYPVPYFGLIYWGISILYVALAVKSCNEEDNGLYVMNNPED